MKKKTTEISINTSSGAEKVERIEKENGKETKKRVTTKTQTPTAKEIERATTVQKSEKERSAKGESALGGGAAEKGAEIKKTNAASTDGKAEKESKAAKARVEAALARKEKEEKRKAARAEKAAKRNAELQKQIAEIQAKIEKRAADKKAKAEKHAAERKALAEKRKAEHEEKLRERAHAKANRNNARYEKKKTQGKHKTEKKSKTQKSPDRNTHRDGREKGYGGWIAAVVSLGVVSLALATTVTVGAVEMTRNQEALMGGYRGTMYELSGIMENVENDLDRARVSNTPAQQSRILTDLLVQTRLAELDVEKLPVEAETDRNVTAFINRAAAECERMLAKLRKGEPLSKQDKDSLEKLYKIQCGIRAELNELVQNMTDKDMMGFMKNGKGSVKDALERIEKSTMEENTVKNGEQTTGAGMDAPQNKAESEGQNKGGTRIEAATAENLCLQYFAGYSIGEFQCIGETVTKGYEAYNVQGYDEKGNQLFAELSQADGTLLRFDYYEDCAGETFDIRNAERIAEEFLEGLGYNDVEVARLRRNGSTTDFTFVYEDDDVLYYPDEIRVKVCRTRGVVSGFDATKYLKNHKPRKEAEAHVSLGKAQDALYDGLEVETSRLVVIDTAMGERTAYEFLCGYQEERYLVFIDAATGEELSIVNVKTVL